MIVLENTDLIEGDATSANEVDFTIYGLDNNVLKQLADGQLANAKGTIYTADSTDVVSSIVLVNTGAAHNHVNLYFKAATSRRLIPKDLQLEPGYSLHFEGGKIMVVDASGKVLSAASAAAHNTTHQDGGADEISVTGLSGLLADDQHVLDTEVLTAVGKTNLAAGFSVVGGTDPKTLTVDETVSISAKAPLVSPAFTTPNLGTPSAGTLTSCTGLPTAGTTFAATDKVLGRATAGAGAGEEIVCTAAGRALIDDADAATQLTTLGAVGVTTTQTLTNKRITLRITTITSEGTPTVNTDNCDCVTITAQAEAITSMTTNLSGTPVNFQKLIVRIKDNGTAQAITWGASFVAKGVALPTTTVISKLLTVGFIYDTVATTWGCVAVANEA